MFWIRKRWPHLSKKNKSGHLHFWKSHNMTWKFKILKNSKIRPFHFFQHPAPTDKYKQNGKNRNFYKASVKYPKTSPSHPINICEYEILSHVSIKSSQLLNKSTLIIIFRVFRVCAWTSLLTINCDEQSCHKNQRDIVSRFLIKMGKVRKKWSKLISIY